MFRILQAKGKPAEIMTAGEALVTGAIVAKTLSSGTVAAASSGTGEYFVDVPKTYTGINSVVDPSDADSTAIASGAKCVVFPAFAGDRFASSEVTRNYADVGDPMVVSSGKLVKASSTNAYNWVYGGVYSDPASTAMHIVEKIAPGTAPATRTVTYNANGGTGTMTDLRSPYFVGKVATVLANGFTAPTYKDFVDYDTADNGSGTNYAPAATITIAGSNVVLYAQYANSHTLLVLDANTGTGTMSDTEKYYVDDVITVPDSTFTPPTGKVFSKWNTLANGTGTDHLPDAEITVTSGMIGAATTLYAIWTDA